MISIPARLRSIPTHRAGLCLGAAAFLALCACQDSPSGSTGPSAGDPTGATGSPTGTLDPTRSGAGDILTFANTTTYGLVVKSDSTVWASGNNFDGQLGDGTKEDRATYVKTISGVRAVSVGVYQSLYAKGDGTAWAAGDNSDGQLGDGTLEDRPTPVKVMDSVAAVSAGYRHSLFVKRNGTAWAVGSNGSGELGDQGDKDRSTPVQVPVFNVVSAAAGTFCSMILDSDGKVWAVGDNQWSQLGNVSTGKLSKPTVVQTDVKAIALGIKIGAFLKTDGSVWVTGWEYGNTFLDDKPKALPLEKVMTDATAIAAGNAFLLMLKKDGTLWAVNREVYRPLASTSSYSDPGTWQVASGVVQISAGDMMGRFLKSDGTLWEVFVSVGTNGEKVTFYRGLPERVQL
ncbi:MAG TPA: hypothetical protein PKO15_00050 [Fibrobacteria bacterium]|nr:hypothetical protein [Fibrobacteria bacterium]HOX50360.1 hypothetical protein [Fibrobacteria bacterium]